MRSSDEESQEDEASDLDNNSELDSSRDDEDDERSDTARHVEHCLDNVKSAGSFASFGVQSMFPLPGLEIDGLGSLGLPLSERDVMALIERCHKSPFGRGSETHIDETVRKTWELDASQFSLTNPAWHSFEMSIIRRVAQDLGIAIEGGGRLVPHRYKLLLYEKGAMFKPHKE